MLGFWDSDSNTVSQPESYRLIHSASVLSFWRAAARSARRGVTLATRAELLPELGAGRSRRYGRSPSLHRQHRAALGCLLAPALAGPIGVHPGAAGGKGPAGSAWSGRRRRAARTHGARRRTRGLGLHRGR